MDADNISDDELLFIVGETDKELFLAGVDVRRRYSEVPSRVMRKLGYGSFILEGSDALPIMTRIYYAFDLIHRKSDRVMGGHIGVFMYHDVFSRISVPEGCGSICIKPFECVDLTPTQICIMQTEPQELSRYIDQFCDVFDIQWGIKELNAQFRKVELVYRYIDFARLHLHAAAAIVTGGYDYRGAVQSALLATELALKSAVASTGLTDEDIRKQFGHDLADLVDFIELNWACFDSGRVRRAVVAQPSYVLNRYSGKQPSRCEVGHTVMRAQFVVSEVVRHMSDRDLRSSMDQAPLRTYPV